MKALQYIVRLWNADESDLKLRDRLVQPLLPLVVMTTGAVIYIGIFWLIVA